jgi:hypothetical protein
MPLKQPAVMAITFFRILGWTLRLRGGFRPK